MQSGLTSIHTARLVTTLVIISLASLLAACSNYGNDSMAKHMDAPMTKPMPDTMNKPMEKPMTGAGGMAGSTY